MLYVSIYTDSNMSRHSVHCAVLYMTTAPLSELHVLRVK